MKKRTNKKIKQAKAVGRFKSRLEKKMWDCLVERGIPATYEEHTYVLVEKFRFTNFTLKGGKGNIMKAEAASIRPMTYTPDFVNEELNFIIECKGFPNDAFPLKWKLFKKYLAENELDYDLYMPRNAVQCEVVADHILSNLKERNQNGRGKKIGTS